MQKTQGVFLKRFQRLVTLGGFLGAMVTAPGAEATTFAVLPMENLIYDARSIVRGQVVSSTSDWGVSADGTKRIYTYTEIEVKEAFKTPAGQTLRPGQIVRIREVGGEKDGLRMTVPGTAHFERGEDTVIFLSGGNLDGSLDVRGMSTGKYEVAQDEKGGEFLTGGMLALAQSDTNPEKKGAVWSLGRLRETVGAQRQKPPAPVGAGPVRTVTVHSEPPPVLTTPAKDLAPNLQKTSSENQADAAQPEKRRAWKWVLGVLLGVLGYALIRRRS